MLYANLIDVVARRCLGAGLHFGHGAANAHDEAWYLIASVLDCAPEALPVTETVPSSIAEKVDALMKLRIQSRKPLPYLTGKAWFYGLELECSEQVLVPRSPIGELLNQQLQPWLSQYPGQCSRQYPLNIVDIGTGSGSLAATAAINFPNARVTAVDIAEGPLALAARNFAKHGLSQRVALQRGDGLGACAGRRFDVIISNPPYVPWQEYLGLPPEYQHEPRLALISPDQGLAFARQLLREAGRHLTDEGLLVVEVGNTMQALMNRWPDFPAEWPVFEQGGMGVFIISASDLAAWRRDHPAL